jgi:HlyD family secretion protein
MRVAVHPGDPVIKGETVVAHMRPTIPAALDIRTREQARAAVDAAEAALRVARADLNKAMADKDLADADLERARTLAEKGTVSQAALDRAQRAARAADAEIETAQAAIAMREAELSNARARLIGFDDQGLAAAIDSGNSDEIPLRAPATGRILQVMQQSETTLPVGTPIMEIGNVETDLEVVVDLLSSDAVQVHSGDRVEIDDWGGPRPLDGVVERVDPYGVTKFSALGVEEQRVNTLIRFTGPAEERENLGHGFRVEARIVVWEDEDAIIAPSSALFRDGADWAVFRVEDGTARLVTVRIGHDNGTQAEVLDGLSPGDRIILYPSAGLADGAKVARRQVN